MIRYTPEQADVMDFITANDGILLVQAGAGTGKSFMSRQIVKELNPKSGIYTAFNKAIVEEGVNRFKGTYIECKTFHALAYRYAKPEKSIETFSYRCITERLTYAEKRRIIDTIDKFYVSSSTCSHYAHKSFATSFGRREQKIFKGFKCLFQSLSSIALVLIKRNNP